MYTLAERNQNLCRFNELNPITFDVLIEKWINCTTNKNMEVSNLMASYVLSLNPTIEQSWFAIRKNQTTGLYNIHEIKNCGTRYNQTTVEVIRHDNNTSVILETKKYSPDKKESMVNFYSDSQLTGFIYPSKELAEKACIKINGKIY